MFLEQNIGTKYTVIASLHFVANPSLSNCAVTDKYVALKCAKIHCILLLCSKLFLPPWQRRLCFW